MNAFLTHHYNGYTTTQRVAFCAVAAIASIVLLCMSQTQNAYASDASDVTATTLQKTITLAAQGGETADPVTDTTDPTPTDTPKPDPSLTVEKLNYKTVKNGLYYLYTGLAPAKKVVGIKGSSTKAGAQAQLGTAKKNQSQKFYIKKIAKHTYTIQAFESGLFLQNSNGKIVQKKQRNATSQQWIAVKSGKGVSFVSKADTSKAIAVAGGKAKNGAKLTVKKTASGKAQRFILKKAPVIKTGYYYISNVASAMVVDVDGIAYANGANVDAYKHEWDNGDQLFRIASKGSYYTIQNAKTYRMVAPKGGSKKAGANVVMQVESSSTAQQWKATVDSDGHIRFINRKSGKCLAVASGRIGANVKQVKKGAADTQEWTLIKGSSYSMSGDKYLDQLVARAWSRTGSVSLRAAFNYITHFPYVSGSKNPSGNWSVPFAKQMLGNHGGNCYRFAAAFCWMARSLGYDARVVKGAVPSRGGGWAPHGWVEIRSGGGTYICDPDLAHELPGHNWYWTTYGSAPCAYQKW